MKRAQRGDRPADQKPGSLLFRMLPLLVVGVLLISACGNPFDSDDDSITPTPTPTPTAADVPAEPEQPTPAPVTDSEDNGTIVLEAPERESPTGRASGDQVLRMTGPTDAPATIDPALVRDTSAAFLARQVFRGLVMLDSELQPVPDLANRIEISDDGTHYRFELHEDLTFHDGTPLTASAVKQSLERAADPGLTDGDGEALPSRNYLDDVRGATERMDGERDDIPGIIVVDEHTLEIELERGVVDFLERLANPSLLIVDVEDAERGATWSRSPNGSGPFRLAEWDDERQIVLTAHEGYVIEPALEHVTVRVGAEAAGEMQLYEGGEIDIANVPLSAIDRIDYEDSPVPGDFRTVELLSVTMVMLNREMEPLDEPDLREALLRSFPREKISEVMVDGRVRAADGIIPPEMNELPAPEYPFGYDTERAREQLPSLEEQVTIYSSGGGAPVAIKQYMEEHLEIEVEVVQLRWADYMADLESKQLPIFVLSWVADGPDPESFLRALFHSDSPDNYAGFSDDRVDELLDDAAIEQDSDRRSSLLAEAQQVILESSVVMPLYHGADYLLVGEHVHGLETTSMGILGLETVWIEE